LFFNNLLRLEPEELLLFFKVGYDLSQSLLEQLDLRLEHLYLVVLLVLLLGVLLDGLLLHFQVILVLLILSCEFLCDLLSMSDLVLL